MKKLLMLLLLISTFAVYSFGTIQSQDLLILENDTILIDQFPLNKFYNKGYSYNPGFFPGLTSTACWRGYKAVWIIRDNRLYLKDLYDCRFEKNTSITDIGRETDKDDLIFADWFSGIFNINMKEKKEISENWNIGYRFMRKKKIKIVNGLVL